MVTRCALLIALAMSTAACGSAPDQVIVVVDSDLPPAEMDAVRIVVTGPEGDVRDATATLGPEDPPLPRTLALSRESGPLGPFEARAVGLLGESEVVSRAARFDFVPGETVILTMHLVRRCVGVDCGAGMTCAERGCRPVLVGPAELPPWTGTPPELGDAGPPDAGRDVGMPDMGTDAGMDACVPMGAEVCDGVLDEDCDGRVDEGFDGAIDVCDDGIDQDCDGRTDEGVPETCNTLDDDCDGTMDEGLTDVAELCDEADQDCDGLVDEGLAGTPETCNDLDDDCDGMTDEGFDRMTDPTNCGTCGNVCSFRNATADCVSGSCVLTACEGTFQDCDGSLDNGCEVDTQLSTSHCGTCSNECRPPLRMCCAGSCARDCG